MEKVLFEVKYPNTDWSEELAEELPAERPSRTEAMEFLDKIFSERTLVLMPNRVIESKRFVALAKRIAETYHVDTKITEHDSHISVTYSFHSNSGMVGLLNVMEMADDISFFYNVDDKPITLVLDYFTHAEYMRGRHVAPLNRKEMFD